MRLEINVFKKKARAQRLKNSEGDKAKMYEADAGAIMIDFAAAGFSGSTEDKVWVVVVEDDD